MNYENDHSLTLLALGFPTTPSNHHFLDTNPPRINLVNHPSEPSLSLSLSGDKKAVAVVVEEPPCSATSSLSNVTVSVKRERPESDISDDDVDGCRVGVDVEEDDGNNTNRKKLRLTKDQSALLEDSFNQQSTLNPKQKQALADRLNLRPRQVEVWFQNRRARSKLKQTEVELEYLKKWCETLSEENKRLQKEVEQLKGLKVAQPIYMQLTPPTTLTMCPSCQTISPPPPPPLTPSTASNKHHPFTMAYAIAPTRPLLVDN